MVTKNLANSDFSSFIQKKKNNKAESFWVHFNSLQIYENLPNKQFYLCQAFWFRYVCLFWTVLPLNIR